MLSGEAGTAQSQASRAEPALRSCCFHGNGKHSRGLPQAADLQVMCCSTPALRILCRGSRALSVAGCAAGQATSSMHGQVDSPEAGPRNLIGHFQGAGLPSDVVTDEVMPDFANLGLGG